MKLKIPKSSKKLVGALTVSYDVYEKLKVLSDNAEVSIQEVIRHILENVIDDVEV